MSIVQEQLYLWLLEELNHCGDQRLVSFEEACKYELVTWLCAGVRQQVECRVQGELLAGCLGVQEGGKKRQQVQGEMRHRALTMWLVVSESSYAM